MKIRNSSIGDVRGRTISLIVLSAGMALCFYFITAVSGHAEEPGGFVFMDLESTVKALEETVNSAGPAVVMVVSYDKSGAEIARGSGFFIGKGGKVITNASVVEDAYSAEIISERKAYPDVAVLDRVDRLDFALLQVDADAERFLNVAFEQEIIPGEKVVIVGKGPKGKRTLSEGSIGFVRELGDEAGSVMELQIAPSLVPLKPAKDGPLLNAEGDVIGLTSARISELLGLEGIFTASSSRSMMAVSASAMKPVLAGSGDAVYLKRAKSKVWTAWLGRVVTTTFMSGFVVLYSMGFQKLAAIFIGIIIVISVIEWVFSKMRRVRHSRQQ